MEIIKSENKDPIDSNIVFPAPMGMRQELTQLRELGAWQVNEMYRKFTAELLAKAKEQGLIPNKAG